MRLARTGLWPPFFNSHDSRVYQVTAREEPGDLLLAPVRGGLLDHPVRYAPELVLLALVEEFRPDVGHSEVAAGRDCGHQPGHDRVRGPRGGWPFTLAAFALVAPLFLVLTDILQVAFPYWESQADMRSLVSFL